MITPQEFDLWEKEVHNLARKKIINKELNTNMSAKTEKQRRKMIREFIEKNKDMVLEHVMDSLLKYPLPGRLLFAFTVVFKIVPKRKVK